MERAIVAGVARSHRRITGRGPSRVLAFTDENVVVVVLYEPLTTAERSLVADGRQDTVRYARDQLRPLLGGAFTDAVQRPSRRTVEAVLSDTHIDPDVTVAVFVLDGPVDGSEK